MKRHLLAAFWFWICLTAFTSQAQVPHRWEFDRTTDREGWSVRSDLLGVVMGGSLWIAFTFKETDPRKIATAVHQTTGTDGSDTVPENLPLLSPRGLHLPAITSDSTQWQVRMRVLNLSPATDILLYWRASDQVGDQPEQFPHSHRCTLKADLKEWQEIICYIDKKLNEPVDQIAVGLSWAPPLRGDLWIDQIEITQGPTETAPVRPDLASAKVVPHIKLPGISQAGFADAFQVLDEALIVDVPAYGFHYPVISPGGWYHWNWWLLDASIAASAAKWTNQSFAEDFLLGLRDLQSANPDGRLPASGWAATRGQVSDLSMLSSFFELAYDVARRTDDLASQREILRTMRRYLDWWLSPVKRDTRTGLISGAFEETFGEDESLTRFFSYEGVAPQSIAPVDLNVMVAVGAKLTAELARDLNDEQSAAKYEQAFQELSGAINTFLWDEVDGVYYNYDLRNEQRHRRMLVTIFDPLRLGIAPPARRDRLLKRMLDPSQFNWGQRPLTSIAKTDPLYTEPKDKFDFDAWLGGVWTLRNLQVISGLKDSGYPQLAAELNWATIREFHNNYREYLIPASGAGGGAQRNALSAAQYIVAIFENLFGVNVNSAERRLTISPLIPPALYGARLTIHDLIIPIGNNVRLSLEIKQTSIMKATILGKIKGEVPAGELLIRLPGSAREQRLSMQRSFVADF